MKALNEVVKSSSFSAKLEISTNALGNILAFYKYNITIIISSVEKESGEKVGKQSAQGALALALATDPELASAMCINAIVDTTAGTSFVTNLGSIYQNDLNTDLIML